MSQAATIDSLVEGFVGSTTRKASGRVFRVGPSWVAFYDTEREKQWVSYAGRYLVRGEPRPESKRRDVPERLRR